MRFELGKLVCHFGRFRIDDLVVGYESSPRRAIVPVATVPKEFAVHEDGTPAVFKPVPGSLFSEGVGYEWLQADPLLRASEPMRNRNRARQTLDKLDAECQDGCGSWNSPHSLPRTNDRDRADAGAFCEPKRRVAPVAGHAPERNAQVTV